MFKSLGFTFILIVLLSNNLYSQNLSIIGKIVDRVTLIPLDGANVNIYDGPDIIKHVVSDTTGQFTISYKSLKKTIYLKISSLNYDELNIDLKSRDLSRNIDLGILKISPRQIELAEVKVKAKKHYRDTTRIDLSKEKFERSIMIDDLLSKDHGFFKDKEGRLYFKGKIVSDLVVNGAEFFGKNNLDIYKLLPALILDNIDVIETNIDSTTNTTVFQPVIKVNLHLKENYNKGKFGNATLGAGTENRFIAATDVYTYKKREQLSFTLNGNNINIDSNPFQQPLINFSANSNNTTANIAKFTYSNLLGKKIEYNFSAQGSRRVKDFISESERKDQITDELFKITSHTNSRLLSLSDARFNLKYNIDPLNTLSFVQLNNYDKTINKDSTNYLLKSDSLNNLSTLSKTLNQKLNSTKSELSYLHKFASKEGRVLNTAISKLENTTAYSEMDNIYNSNNLGSKSYFVNNQRSLHEKFLILNFNFTEPIKDDSFLNFFSIFQNSKVNYLNKLTSDSSITVVNPDVKISNNIVQQGMKFHVLFNKLLLNTELSGLFNVRTNHLAEQKNQISFFNINFDFRADYKINEKKNVTINFKATPLYPETNQLININTSYDLIFQTTGNINLKPQSDNSFKFTYVSKKENGDILNLDARLDLYTSKYGLRINALPNTIQTSYIDNIGNALSTSIAISILKNNSSKFNLNYTSNISYLEQPTIINGRYNLNNGITLTQTIYATTDLIKNLLTLSPVITAGYSKYYYQSSNASSLNIIYSDKVTLTAGGFDLDLYPFFNYSHSVNNLTSFSVNGSLSRNLMKQYVKVWFQGYNLLNSFKYNNIAITSSYIETTRYSNIRQYFILGISFKFNNMK